MIRFLISLLVLQLITFCLPVNSRADSEAISVPDSGLVLRSPGRSGRTPFHANALEALLVDGKFTTPHAGDKLKLPDGQERVWEPIQADKDHDFTGDILDDGWLFLTVNSPSQQAAVAVISGPSMAYINGEPRMGDPYSYGYTHLPVMLHAGENSFLMPCARGHAKLTLTKAAGPALLNINDLTLPDYVLGQRKTLQGALIVLNATSGPLSGLAIAVTLPGGKSAVTKVPTLNPLSFRKVAFTLPSDYPSKPGEFALQVQLTGRKGGKAQILDHADIKLRVRKPEESRKITFISQIDGSLQYYALVPAQQPAASHAAPPSLVLTLHGASVEAIGQADAYAPKRWAHLVAPTNRRPYGFDWEDWGRKDALEVLGLAKKSLAYDPRRVYLTGHSMGGHGTWQLGVLYPELFAGIAPSAGWISFVTYAGGQRLSDANPIEKLLQRAAAPSDTISLGRNYAQEGVYILHGDADDNVPVTEARRMRDFLATFHHDFQLFEQPGAGHWWGNSDEPGAACVDWPGIFDMFSHHSLPSNDSLRLIDFTTPNPAVTSSAHWAVIEQQTHAMLPSRIQLKFDPILRRFSGTSENVTRLRLATDFVNPGDIKVELDGQKLTIAARKDGSHAAEVSLKRTGDAWSEAVAVPVSEKSPLRGGPFKEAFDHRMIFVYGTKGSDEENRLLWERARRDAENFWYRGNGSVDIIADTEFHAEREPDRGVVLYGNAETNAAWKALLGDSPVQVNREGVKLGARMLAGDDLACLFLRPRPESTIASVAVVSGTGLKGIRLTAFLPYLQSGIAYPDCVVVGADMLEKGISAVRAAGYFGNDWGVASGEFTFREP